MFQQLQAAIALALTLFAMATIVTVVVEIVSRLGRRRAHHFQHMVAIILQRELGDAIRAQLNGRRLEGNWITALIDGVSRGYIEELLRAVTSGREEGRIKRMLRRRFADRPAIRDLLVSLTGRFCASWLAERRRSTRQNPPDPQRFIDRKINSFGEEIYDLLPGFFAHQIATSPFRPRMTGWWSRFSAGIPLVFGATEQTQISTEEFVQRLGRSGARWSLDQLDESRRDIVIASIAQRFEEVSAGARAYFGDASRIVSMLVAVLFAFAVNVNAVRIYQDFLQIPEKAAALGSDAEFGTQVKASVAAVTKASTEINKAAEKVDSTSDGKQLVEAMKAPAASLEKAAASLKDIVEASTGVRFAIGWTEFPHCLLGMNRCASAAWMTGWNWQQGLPLVGLWILTTLVTGLLIGLGGPFWYDATMGLMRAAQVLRGGRLPDQKPSAERIGGEPAKGYADRYKATSVPGVAVVVERQVALRSAELDRLKKKIEEQAGIVVSPCNQGVSLPPALDLPDTLSAVNRGRIGRRYSQYLEACKKLQELGQ